MNTNTNRLALSKQGMQKTQKIKLNQNQQSSVDMCPVVTVHSCVTQYCTEQFRWSSLLFSSQLSLLRCWLWEGSGHRGERNTKQRTCVQYSVLCVDEPGVVVQWTTDVLSMKTESQCWKPCWERRLKLPQSVSASMKRSVLVDLY